MFFFSELIAVKQGTIFGNLLLLRSQTFIISKFSLLKKVQVLSKFDILIKFFKTRDNFLMM